VARRQRLDGELSSETLVHLDAVLHEDPPNSGIQELRDRQAAAALAHGDDNPIGMRFLNDLVEARERAEHRVGRRRRHRMVGHAYQAVAQVSVVLNLLGDSLSQRAGAQYHHAFGEWPAPHQAIEHRPERQDEPADHQETGDERAIDDLCPREHRVQ
jgi:hypothetical protein